MSGSGGCLRQNTELPGDSPVVPVLAVHGYLPVAELHQLHAFELGPLAGRGQLSTVRHDERTACVPATVYSAARVSPCSTSTPTVMVRSGKAALSPLKASRMATEQGALALDATRFDGEA